MGVRHGNSWKAQPGGVAKAGLDATPEVRAGNFQNLRLQTVQAIAGTRKQTPDILCGLILDSQPVAGADRTSS